MALLALLVLEWWPLRELLLGRPTLLATAALAVMAELRELMMVVAVRLPVVILVWANHRVAYLKVVAHHHPLVPKVAGPLTATVIWERQAVTAMMSMSVELATPVEPQALAVS